MGDIFHVRFDPVERGVEDRRNDRADNRVLLSLDLVEAVQHAAVVGMNLGKVVEDIMQECRKTLPRDDICITQRPDEELSMEIRTTLKK